MIKFLKLLTGEEIVSDVKDVDDNYVLSWPAKLLLINDPETNEPKTSVVAFTPHVKGHTIAIHKTKVLYVAEPVANLKDYYEKNFGNMIPPSAAELEKAPGIELSSTQVAEIETK